MKIFAASLATETNTFSPIPTGRDDFDVTRPEDTVDGKIDGPFGEIISLWEEMSKEKGFDYTWSLAAVAPPGGRTVKAVYEGFRDEIIDELKATLPVDIVLLALHGAMVAQEEEDCEGDIIRRIRKIVGPDVVIGLEIDPHCHLTKLMISKTDIIIIFKEYPHVDFLDRARELFDLAVRAKQGKIRPAMAMFDCRMMGIFPTSAEPFRSFVDSLIEHEKEDKVLSLSLGHGFPYGDVVEGGTRMLAITDNDHGYARTLAEEFGRKVVGMRHHKPFDYLPVQEALHKAAASEKAPVVVADQADNPGGGAPSDSTFALKWLLDHNVTNAAIAFMWDPVVVQIVKTAGEASTIDVRLGGKMGPMSGDPLDLTVTVRKIIPNYEVASPVQNGKVIKFRMGDTVAINCRGIDIIVSSRRNQCYFTDAFSDFGVDPTKRKILIPKSTQHFYAAFSPIAEDIIYMSSPGALNSEIKEIPFKVMDKNKFPWVNDPFSRSK